MHAVCVTTHFHDGHSPRNALKSSHYLQVCWSPMRSSRMGQVPTLTKHGRHRYPPSGTPKLCLQTRYLDLCGTVPRHESTQFAWIDSTVPCTRHRLLKTRRALRRMAIETHDAMTRAERTKTHTNDRSDSGSNQWLESTRMIQMRNYSSEIARSFSAFTNPRNPGPVPTDLACNRVWSIAQH
jgi:hypothetical protein